jgi:hypothetical protein
VRFLKLHCLRGGSWIFLEPLDFNREFRKSVSRNQNSDDSDLPLVLVYIEVFSVFSNGLKIFLNDSELCEASNEF